MIRYNEIFNELMNDSIVMDVVKRKAIDEMTYCLRAYGAVGSLFDAIDAIDAINLINEGKA